MLVNFLLLLLNCDTVDISLLSQFAQVQFIMPRGYKKNKSRRRSSSRKGFRNNEISNLSSVILNPFSNVSTIPRIPDGLAAYSTGYREQITEAVNLDGIKYLLLYPGLTRPFITIEDPPNQNPAADLTLGVMTGGRLLRTNEVAFTGSMAYVESVRIVSQGLSMKCTSNSQNNDGYFEAIRLSSNSLSREAVNIQAMANHPSYVHGKIRDLDSYTWQLKPAQASRWIDPAGVKDVLDIKAVTPVTDLLIGGNTEEADGDEIIPDAAPGSTVFTNPPQGSNSAVPLALDYNDPTFDTILIKLVPTSTLLSSPTQVFLHAVTNFEVVYDESTQLAKFMTSAPKDLDAWERCKSVLTSNMKACRSIYHAR